MTATQPRTRTAPVVAPEALRALVDDRSRVLGLTRDSLAAAAQIGRSTLYDWLAGRSTPSPSGWRVLAGALQLDVTEMFDALGAPAHSDVEERCRHRGWTRGDLARHARVSFATVRELEHVGQVRPDAALRVARVLELPGQFVSGSSRVARPATTPLGQYIEATRLRRGWTVADLARHIGVARQLVSAWQCGKDPVARRWLPQLAELGGVDVRVVEALVGARTATP